jgi:Ran GTPase-activating protein (RanGAP) involved in mRNA processing and transport
MADLQSLDLSNNRLTDDDMSALTQHAARHWPQLQTLNLNCNVLGDDGMRALADAARHWAQLHTLGLCHNKLGPAGMTALVRFWWLVALVLGRGAVAPLP